MKKKRVVVAMSGGVDSSVAAYLLKEEGYEVIGISMQLYDHSNLETRFDSCCSLKDVDTARRVAQILDIPYYVLNFEKKFKEKVVDYFTNDYLKGRTPNPCVKCNEEVKFKHLILKARELKSNYLATGHYVKKVCDRGICYLKKAKDRQKDQSYFLFSIEKETLPFLLFPLGDLTKSQVRDIAREAKLPNSEKKESMEICFIPDQNYSGFISKVLGGRSNESFSGEMIHSSGEKLATHDGFYKFTVGQRKGLGISGRDPLYVLNVNPESRAVRVGSREELYSRGLIAENINWLVLPKSERVATRIRYRHSEIDSQIESGWEKNIKIDHEKMSTKTLTVRFSSPQRAVTPGQAAVFYEGDTLLGGGWIERGLQ